MANNAFSTGRWRYLWLVAGVALSLVGTSGEWAIPVAAWLFSIALMRFTRGARVVTGFLWVALFSVAEAVVLVAAAGRFAVLPILLGCAIPGVLLCVPLLVDRLLFRRLNPIAATLVFPAARVAVEFLVTQVSPFGTVFGPLAATQSANLPFLQLVSVTGVYGLSFLMAWLAPIVNVALECRWHWPSIRTVALAYVSVLVLVLFGGGLRLALASDAPNLVRVAGISVSRAAEERSREIDNFHTPQVLSEQKPVLRQAFAVLNEDLFARSRIEADGGAKIVTWAETAAVVLEEDYPEFMHTARELARDKQIYLGVGIAVLLDGQQQPRSRDIAVLVAPDGQVLSTYDKAHPVPGMESLRPGDGIAPVSATPYGRLANVICFDAQFPGTLRTRADIMLVPSNDWPGIERAQAANAVFRAVENGYSLVRQTSNGISITVDMYGQNLARTNYFSTTQQSMIVSVPTRGTRTVYGVVGDLFAWLCVAGLAGSVALVVFRRIGSRG
ncbi:nitrilase-related carbon-nitrogen hydrolase [Nocardia sp. NPDC051756]|uniref:nitrilase-related carbon-nitrogen hydrolase n=1 Tax=Nocardia sp. NPDC051756 TaxID=3154751 RepID=UPI003443044D